MIPASFARMIFKLIAPFARMIFKLIAPKLTEHIAKIFKLEKLLTYMELPNDADIRIDKLEEQNLITQEQLKLLAKEIGKNDK